MTSEQSFIKKDPKDRPYGFFKPDPNMIGYILGRKGESLRDIAKTVPGAFIRFNDQSGHFDVWARSNDDVKKVRKLLAEKQNMTTPEASKTTKKQIEHKVTIVTIGDVVLSIKHQRTID